MLSKPTFRLSLLLLIGLLALSCWSIYLVRPPQAQPATAPLTEFSAERAMQYVRQIAREPHAMGTPDHARVRTYLLNTLRSSGLQPQVQEATVAGPLTNEASIAPSGAMLRVASMAGHVYNIMGRLKGTEPGKAILLMAHYDSQQNTPGAGDDGAGVAAILETVRAIQRGKPLRHAIILLFTDGEENGLFGAKAFLRHPWAREVGFVINLEARGNSGPSLTFEVSSDNGWIVEQMAQAVPHAMPSSLMYEVYRTLPNSTDFTVFREAGYAGVNSAFIDGFVHYHKLTDSPENLNQNSLQHHGDNLLALARHMGNAPLDRMKAPDKVFFNGAGDWLVQYPLGLDWFWMALLTAVLVTVFRLGLRGKESTVGQVFAAFGLYVVILLLTGIVCWVINMGVHGALPLTHFFNGSYGSSQFFVAYSLITLGTAGLLIQLVLRWLRPQSLILGVYGLIYALTIALFVFLPAGTYLLMFPLLSALTGMLIVQWQTRRQPEWRPAHVLILLIAALPTLFIILPIANLLSVTFDLQLPLASVLLLSLAFGLLLPLWLITERGLRWRNVPALPIGLLAIGGAVTLLAIRNEAPDARQPLHTQVAYFLNDDTKQAVWASYRLLTTDNWNRQFFRTPSTGQLSEIYPAVQPSYQKVYLKSKADLITDSPPIAEVLSDVTIGSTRRLTLELRSPRGAANLEAGLFPSPAGTVKSVRLNGEPLALKAQPTSIGPGYDFLLLGLPVTRKVTLTIDLTAGGPLRVLLFDQSIGLPPELVKIARPASVIPEQGRTSNLTVIGKTYQF